jgi:hypothetical protein
MHANWLKQLLTTPGDAGGPPLGQEPALAMVEIVNEDSMFFWTFNKKNIPPAQWAMLQELLSKKVGEPRELLEIGALTPQALKNADAPRLRRAQEQVRFMAELQKEFYTRSIKAMRDAGAQNLAVCSNWITADASTFDPIERWTYTAGDVVEQHGYFSGKHEGDGAGYSVRVGHKYADLAGVLVPERLPIRIFSTDGFPSRISEINWTPPNRFRADATLLASAYGSLQGLDALDWFIVGNNYLNDGPGGKFTVGGPSMFGTFPANALMFRKRLVKEAEPVVQARISNDELFSLKGTASASVQALDELRAKDIPSGQSVEGEVSKFDPLNFYVGRVTRACGEGASRQVNTSQWIDRDQKIVRSMTGELNWDYGNGVVKVQTPTLQAAVGFLKKGGALQLSSVGFDCSNEYGQVIVVALDDQPIERSKKLLVQVMTEERFLGERVVDGKIESLGTYPPGVKLIDVQVSLKGWAEPTTVQALDENGYATGDAVVTSADRIRLPQRALHCIISR